MKRKFSTGAHRQYGTVTVETAIALPLLMLLFLATAEVGRAYMHYNTLEKSVRDGAMYLSIQAIVGATGVINVSSTCESNAKNLARFGNTAGNGDTLLPNFTAGMLNVDVPDANHVSLIADYPYQPMLFDAIPTFGYGSDVSMLFTMRASVTMRAIERWSEGC